MFEYPVQESVWVRVHEFPETPGFARGFDLCLSPGGPPAEHAGGYMRLGAAPEYLVLGYSLWWEYPRSEINGALVQRDLRGYRFSGITQIVDSKQWRRFDLDSRAGAVELAEEYIAWYEEEGSRPDPPPLPARFR